MNEMDRLRGKLSKGKPRGKLFEPPRLLDFAPGIHVLAFDPTLTNCGWVRLEIKLDDGQPWLQVWGHGTIRPRTDEKGFMATWDKARYLNDELALIIRRASRWPGSVVVCETPWVGSGGHRTESALMAGSVVYLYAGELFRPVSAQHAYSVLCGGRRPATSQAKKDIAVSVARYILDSAGRGWNEHERDAAALALTYLYDLNKEKRP